MNTKTLLLGAIATFALTGSANAAVFKSWYVGLEAGGNWIQDTDLVLDNASQGTASFDTGWAGLGTLGYAWNNFRVELELGYRANDPNSFFAGKIARGEFNEFSQMLNIVYDWDFARDWGLSFGAGGGGDDIIYKDDSQHSVPLHDTNWVFAWQLLAGLNYHINARTELFVDYRYFNAQSPEFTEMGPGPFLHSDRYDDVVKHTATIGIRYALWGAEEPMEVVAPPPPPPSPEPAAAPKEFIVFFGHNKSNLVPEAMKVVHEAAAAAKQYGSASINVVGHADRSGSDAYNNALSMRRAKVVSGALVAEGIPQGAVSVSAKGESEPLVPTADGVREPQNRRVNISM